VNDWVSFNICLACQKNLPAQPSNVTPKLSVFGVLIRSFARSVKNLPAQPSNVTPKLSVFGVLIRSFVRSVLPNYKNVFVLYFCCIFGWVGKSFCEVAAK